MNEVNTGWRTDLGGVCDRERNGMGVLMNRTRRWTAPNGRVAVATACVAFVACSCVTLAQAPSSIALTGARVITVTGGEIDSGIVVIENGRITAVGADIDIPYDAMEYDLSGKVIMPGMIDPHAPGGMDVANETLPVTPFLNVYDAIDPSRRYFEDALRDGVTTVHAMAGNNTVIAGISRLVRPIGLSIDEMTVEPDVAMKLSTTPKSGYDRMRQMHEMREAFHRLDRALEDLAEKRYEEDAEENDRTVRISPEERREKGRELIRDEDLGEEWLNLVRMERGDMAAWFYAGAAMDVEPALAIAADRDLTDRTVLVLGETAHKAVGAIKTSGRPVVLDGELFDRERDPFTGEVRETFVPKVFHDAGVLFALQPNASSSLAERYLNYQAAVCVRNGVPRDAALKAITLNPAKILGVDEHFGSIEEGKVGNIVVFSGDPLDFGSWVEMVFVDGVLAYDRSEDPRLAELLRLQQLRDTADDGDRNGDDAEEDGGDGDDTAGDAPSAAPAASDADGEGSENG